MGTCIWLTGLPCSGKTTIGNGIREQLPHLNPVILDGDEMRDKLEDSGYPKFSKEDRDHNVVSIGSWASLYLSRNVPLVICSVIAPYARARHKVKLLIEGTGHRFIEVYVDAPLDKCEERDVKGMYAKARAGLIDNFTGIDDPYEAPKNPDIRLNTAELSVEDSINTIIRYLQNETK